MRRLTMGWSTELFCNISYNRKTFNSKIEVEDEISDLDNRIESCKKVLRDMALMTEPSKFVDNNTNPYYFVTEQVEDNLELLEEYIIERYKLLILLDSWDNCHNKEGLAIYPPDNVNWNTAYLHGDFVKSTKYPTNKDLLG